MHTPQEWHHHAGENMDYAAYTQKKAQRQINTSRKAHEDTVNDNLACYGDLNATLRQKVQNSHRLIDLLTRRADSLTASIQHCQQSLASLEAAHRAKDPQIQLCQWRMEQRERRPLREQVRDPTETTLEQEKELLCDTQRRLSEAMKRTRSMISELEQKLNEVRHDLDHKGQALGVDETCLRTAQRSYQTALERSRPQSSPPGPTRLPGGMMKSRPPNTLQETARNELNRQQDAMRQNQSAAQREHAAKVLRDDNKMLIARCQKAAEDAAQRTEKALQERINEAQQLRRRLEGEIRETSGKIDHTRHTISETRNQIKSLEEPMDMTTTCSAYRKQRATREHINDPVTTMISEHQNTVLRAHHDLVGHHEAEKNNLQDLNERKERLKDDLRDKTSAMHIDLNCLSHESVYRNGKHTPFISKAKLSRATMVDSSFVPLPGTGVPVYPMTAR